MTDLNVLIGNDDSGIEGEVRSLAGDATARFVCQRAEGIDNILESIVMNNPDLCIIRDARGIGDTPDILKSLAEAGLKIPVIAVVDPEFAAVERELLALGGKGAVPLNGSLKFILRYFLSYATEVKEAELSHREEKDELIRQLFELQDSRDRMERQSINLVDLAEELSMAKDTLELLNSEKDKFFSIIAHDLRSPFNTILGYTEMLVRSADTLSADQVKEFAGNANTAGNRIFALLENLLEWARIQMDRIDYLPSDAHLSSIVGKAIDPLAAVAEDKGVVIKYCPNDDRAFVDRNMIETVIRNLINNAIKFTNPGGEITITHVENGAWIDMFVADTGIGMSPDKTKAIFSLSESSSQHGTLGEKGSGLGLILCQDIVQRSGGTIDVTSEPGVGTTVHFTVPATDGTT